MTDVVPAEGSMAIRGGRIVHASEGLAALAGRPVGDLLGREPAELLAPEDRARVAWTGASGPDTERSSRSLEVTLLLPGGGRRAVGWHIDRDLEGEVVHLRDLSLERTRWERLEALALTAVRIRGELTEKAVHDCARRELERLGIPGSLLEVSGSRARVVWMAVPDPIRASFAELIGVAPEEFVGAVTPLGQRVLAEGCAFTDDWAADVASFFPADLADGVRAFVAGAGPLRCIGVRLSSPDEAVKILTIGAPWLVAADVSAMRMFGAQVSAALDAARTIATLSLRNAHLAALARVAELAGEAADLSSFFARASEAVRPVAGYAACAVFVADEAAGELVRLHQDPVPAALEERGRRYPLASPVGEVVRERVARVLPVPYPGERPEILEALPFRSVAWVPLVARSRGVGALVAGFEGDVTQAQGAVELLSAVGAHFASAIESHGLLSDLRRRVTDLGAVHALMLRVLASPAGDVGALLEDGCEVLARVLDAPTAAVHLAGPGGISLRSAAAIGVPPEYRDVAIDPSVDAIAQEVIRTRSALQSADATRDPRSQLFGRADLPPISVLAVPLVSRRDVRGIAFVGDRAGRRFGPGEVAVANALAGALGIGLENAELYAESRRQLDALSAMNEAGRAIAGSLDPERVMREAAEAARRLLRSDRGYVILYDAAHGELRFAAGTDEGLRGMRTGVPPGGLLERVLRARRAGAVEDAAAGEVSEYYRRVGGGRALAVAPVLLRGEPVGILVVDELEGPRRYTEQDLERLTGVADRLAVALENARLFEETRRRAEELGVLLDVGRSLSETLDIERVLDAGVRSLARIVNVPAAYLCLLTPDGASLEFRAISGDARAQAFRGTLIPARPAEHNLGAGALASRAPVVVEDALADPRPRPDLVERAAARAELIVPLVLRDRAIGVVICVETSGPRRFTPAEVERLTAVANQLAVAAENARLYDDLRRSYADLERAQQRLVQGERLAALGQLSAVVAHEVRNPLGVIFNSLGSLRRLVRPAGDAKMLFDIVEEESERLNRIVGDLLDFARPATPELRPEAVGPVLEDAVEAAVPPQAERIEIVRALDPDLPPIPVDARLLRQAVLNLAVNAVQAMPRGGRITLRTRREEGAAVIELEDTGAGIPEEVRGRIFEPFFTTKASGTGLGLAVVRRIVEGHGGEVRVRSAPGAGTTFTLRLPLGAAAVENGPAMR